MILCAHIRACRDIFLTSDRKAFVNEGRRQQLATTYKTRIMTRDEFVREFIPTAAT